MFHYILLVLIAIVSSALFGYLWYHPRIGFGRVWMRHVHITPDHAESAHQRVVAAFFGTLLSLVFMALILGRFLNIVPQESIYETIAYIVSIWVGFIVPPILGIVMWEGRAVQLFLVNSGYWFMVLTIMTSIFTFL